SAARAFELRMLEFQSAWRRSGHPMVVERPNDLLDAQLWVTHHLLGLPEPDFPLSGVEQPVLRVARDLTLHFTLQLHRSTSLDYATDAGSRTSHSAILARSIGLPAVVSLGDISSIVENGQELVLDGRAGRVIVEPTEFEKSVYRERDVRVREWEQEL